MSEAPKERRVTGTVWFAGLTLVVFVLVAGPITLLRAGKARVARLQTEIDGKEATLASYPHDAEYAASLQAIEAALAGWRAMHAGESTRLAELSAVARASGTTLTSIQALEKRASTEGRVVISPYRLRLRGRYAQLASFCDGLYAAQGLTGIDELEIEPADDGGESGLLQASLEIAWYAPHAASAEGPP